MPTIGVNRDDLFKNLGKSYTEEEFDELCFEYGIELDEVTSEKEQIEKEQGSKKAAGASDAVIYKIDIPANRYDLLCMEGLVQALKVFLQFEPAPQFQRIEPTSGIMQKLIVKESTQSVRPHCVGAVLRNITFTPEVYASFIDLQDKLHQNIGRRRSLVSIGTHDLDTITGPFRYEALPPNEIKFIALNQAESHTAAELMEIFKETHLKPYLAIIKDSPLYPVIFDSNGVVLSMPPIINGDHSKIKLSTRNVFIEITATDLTKARITLDTIVAMFSTHCDDKFTVEPILVENFDGKTTEYPTLNYRQEIVTADYLNKKIGIDIDADTIASKLTKMCLKSEVTDKDKGEITVTIPPTRSDVIHSCDIVEDVAVAYGYNNIEKTFPRSVTVGRQQICTKVSERLRHEVVAAGFTEALTFSLCSREDVGVKIRKTVEEMERTAVKIANPKTLEFQVVRTSLIPGLLKTIASNKKMPIPLKLFELQEVSLLDSSTDTGARNERRLSAVYYNKTPGFEVIHGLLDKVMRSLEFTWSVDRSVPNSYCLQAAEDSTFFPGRCAHVVCGGEVIGTLGVIHPEVLSNFELPCPVSAFEINIEKLY